MHNKTIKVFLGDSKPVRSQVDGFSIHLKVNLIGIKVNSVQEACAKFFAAHILKFDILPITNENETKNIRPLVLVFTNTFSILMFFVLFFHVVCKISNSNK